MMDQNGRPEEKRFANETLDNETNSNEDSMISEQETGNSGTQSGQSTAFNQAEPANWSENNAPAAPVRYGAPVRRAGFWMRFWAYLLDLAVIGSIGGIIADPLFRFLDIPQSGGLFSPKTIVSAVIFYLYFVLMTKFFRQTLGKMVFGLAVIDLKDGQLSWMDVLFREWIGRFISQTIFILYVIPAFHPQKQGLHDIFADTAVIHTER
jgi:uncharacterized RDD family membrane protein YckC